MTSSNQPIALTVNPIAPIELTVENNRAIISVNKTTNNPPVTIDVVDYVVRPEELPFFNLYGAVDGDLLAWDAPSQTIVPLTNLPISLTMPADVFNINQTGNTINVTFDNQPANYVLASPSTGLSGTPAFRQLVPNDVASIFANSGTISFSFGSAISASVRANSITEAMLAFNVATQEELELRQPISTSLTQIANIVAAAAGDIMYFDGSSWRAADAASLGLTNASNLNVGTIPNARIVNLPLTNLANQPSLTILGNNSVSSAKPIALTLAQVKTLLNLSVSDVAGSNDASNLTTGTLPNARIADLPLPNLANQASLTILGNNTAGLAKPIALNASQVKTLLSIANTDVSGLGTASTRNVPASGDASTSQVVLGADTRLTNPRYPINWLNFGRSIGAYLRADTSVTTGIVLSAGTAMIQGVFYTWNTPLTFSTTYGTTGDAYAYLSAPGGVPALELSFTLPTFDVSNQYYCKAGDTASRLLGSFKIANNGTTNVVVPAAHILQCVNGLYSVQTSHNIQGKANLTHSSSNFFIGSVSNFTSWVLVSCSNTCVPHSSSIILRITSQASNSTTTSLLSISGFPNAASVVLGDDSTFLLGTPATTAVTLLTRGAFVNFLDGLTGANIYVRSVRTAGTGTVAINLFCLGSIYAI